MFAALAGCRESVETLLLMGADPDILDGSGDPALASAIQAGDQGITERLVAITNKGGETNRGQQVSLYSDCF